VPKKTHGAPDNKTLVHIVRRERRYKTRRSPNPQPQCAANRNLGVSASIRPHKEAMRHFSPSLRRRAGNDFAGLPPKGSPGNVLGRRGSCFDLCHGFLLRCGARVPWVGPNSKPRKGSVTTSILANILPTAKFLVSMDKPSSGTPRNGDLPRRPAY